MPTGATLPRAAAPAARGSWSPIPAGTVPGPRPADQGLDDLGTEPVTSTSGGAPLAPQWANVPERSFDTITGGDQVDGAGLSDVAGPGGGVDREDPVPQPRRLLYTLLKAITLALVAFVLGFIVWSLIKGSAEPGATGAAAPAPIASSSAISSPHQGEQ